MSSGGKGCSEGGGTEGLPWGPPSSFLTEVRNSPTHEENELGLWPPEGAQFSSKSCKSASPQDTAPRKDGAAFKGTAVAFASRAPTHASRGARVWPSLQPTSGLQPPAADKHSMLHTHSFYFPVFQKADACQALG